MPQESPHETNNTTNSSALGTKSLFYHEVIFVSEKHSLQVLYIYELENWENRNLAMDFPLIESCRGLHWTLCQMVQM